MMVLLILVFLLIPVQDLSLLCLAQSIYPDDLKYPSEKGLLAKKGCQDRCGDVWIPYPFGIGGWGHDRCYHNEWFEIICNTSYNPARPFLTHSHLYLEITGIHLHSIELDVKMKAQNVCLNNGAAVSIDLQRSPYRYSASENFFTAWGSNGILVKDRKGNPLTLCAPIHLQSISAGIKKLIWNNTETCPYEIGCCETKMDDDVDYYEIHILNYDLLHGCNTSAIYRCNDMNVTKLTWYPPRELFNNSGHANFSCSSDHSCQCEPPYDGNPYLPYGCQVDCFLHEWTEYCRKRHLSKLVTIIGLSIGIGLVLLLLFVYWLYKFVRRTLEMKRKSKNFKRNGGFLLQRQISTDDGVVNKTKIFSLIELNTATDNFNENRILGQGGQGTVYKGMMEDGKIVAIKKSKKVDEDQLEQFINEVVIVSQINHRNVVKMLGCCLETEVPLLVYEFIPYGTL